MLQHLLSKSLPPTLTLFAPGNTAREARRVETLKTLSVVQGDCREFVEKKQQRGELREAQ